MGIDKGVWDKGVWDKGACSIGGDANGAGDTESGAGINTGSAKGAGSGSGSGSDAASAEGVEDGAGRPVDSCLGVPFDIPPDMALGGICSSFLTKSAGVGIGATWANLINTISAAAWGLGEDETSP